MTTAAHHRLLPMHADEKLAIAQTLVAECQRIAHECADGDRIRRAVASMRLRAVAIQGAPQDHRYLCRTLCKLARVVRTHGWIAIALETLEWALTQACVDEYILTEIACCHLARQDARAIESTLTLAHTAGVPVHAIYTTLLKAHARGRDTASARLTFDRAAEEGALSEYAYPALINAYGLVGDVAAAHDVFRRAESDRLLSAAAFTALATVYRSANDLHSLHALTHRASRSGHLSPALVTVAVRAYVRVYRFSDARRILDLGRSLGHVDGRCYSALISASHEAGRHRSARGLRRLAASDPALSQADKQRVASIEHGYYGRSRAGERPARHALTVRACR